MLGYALPFYLDFYSTAFPRWTPEKVSTVLTFLYLSPSFPASVALVRARKTELFSFGPCRPPESGRLLLLTESSDECPTTNPRVCVCEGLGGGGAGDDIGRGDCLGSVYIMCQSKPLLSPLFVGSVWQCFQSVSRGARGVFSLSTWPKFRSAACRLRAVH